MLFINYIVLVDKLRSGVNDKQKLGRQTLEYQDFRMSRSKRGYIAYKFSKDYSYETLNKQEI